MLSGLRVRATYTAQGEAPQTFEWDYGALSLLAYLQQVWPGIETGVGQGTKSNPYRPTTAKQWFHCAKLKGSGGSAKRFPNLDDGLAWFKLGGRFIAVDPKSFYSSDYGAAGAGKELANPTYPELRKQVAAWRSEKLENNDAKLTRLLREAMQGKLIAGAPKALPVLASVLFISEVCRNHTSFHTNLMALDLIEHGASLPLARGGSIPWTWENAIWIEDACPTCSRTGEVSCGACGGHGRRVFACRDCTNGTFKPALECKFCRGRGCGSCRNTGIFKPAVSCRTCAGTGRVALRCDTCGGTGAIGCKRCNGRGQGTVYDEFGPGGYDSSTRTLGGGAEALQNGLLPMSHMGSAFGAAFDLGGSGQYEKVKGGTDGIDRAPSALTVVRRKEATVLVQWLHLVLGGTELAWDGDKKRLKIETACNTDPLPLDALDFTSAYAEVEGEALLGRSLDDDRRRVSLEQEVRDSVRAKIIAYIEIRCGALWYGLGKG
jgi:hypothetical protein